MKTLALIAPLVGVLAGCQMDDASQAAPSTPPDSATIRAVATQSYQNALHKGVTDLRIGSVQLVQAFYTLPPDYIVCVTTKDREVNPTYNNSGQLIRPVGTPYRQSWAMLMREYSGTGWGAGVFRQVDRGKIGRIELLTVCPPSER